MLGDQYGDTRERVLSGVGDARAQFTDMRDRSAAQLNDVRSQFGDAERYVSIGISDVRSQYDDAERRVVGGLNDARAQFTDAQRRGYATADRVSAGALDAGERRLERMQSAYLPEGRIPSIYASPLASPRAYAAGHPAGEYLPAAAAGYAAGPAGTYNMV